MPIITSKTDQAIRNEFNRRGFLKLAGSAGFGAVIYSQLGSQSLAIGPPKMVIPAGFGSFLKKFGGFALDIGMSLLGARMPQWLSQNPLVSQGFNSFMNSLNGIKPPMGGFSPYQNFDLFGGYNSTFLPIYNQNNGLYMLPFFNQSNGRLGSGIQWFSGASLPPVNDIIKNDDGLEAEDRAQYLVPRAPRKNNWQDNLLPERYSTDAGSTEFQYKGDGKSGEVAFNIWKKESSGTLEKISKKGRLGVELST
jgi:hypothetical protein